MTGPAALRFMLPPPTAYLRPWLYVNLFLAYTGDMNRPTAPRAPAAGSPTRTEPGRNGRRVTLYLPDDLIRRARHHGLDTGRSLSDLAREGLERVLTDVHPETP